MRTKLIIILAITVNASLAFSQDIPYAESSIIKEIEFDWSTHVSLAPGSDNWPITWADDNNQYSVWGDGGGFGGTNSLGRSSIGIARIDGDWQDFKGFNVWGGHNGENDHNIIAKSYGIICIDGILYMWCGMFQTHKDQFNQTKIAYSKNHGATWEFANWSFTREEGIMMPTICNYDKNYENAKDDFVYMYLIRFQSYEGPDNYEDKVDWLNCQKPGLIDLARVHKDSILIHNAYSFFSGTKRDKPIWVKKINQRQPVFENPNGVGWCINVSYNSKLERYFLTTEHTETHRGNIGIFDAPEPWGPWTTVLYDKSWGKGFIPLNTFYWNFSNKWLSKDGESFSLIFTGRKENDSFNVIRGKFITEN